MGKKVKTGKARKDRFYFLAKETGYRSRAAFKLIQLNRRFNFLGSSKVLIDLCAAPGGWLQVASREMPVSSLIIGVDLVHIQPIPRVKTFAADITTDKCKQAFTLATEFLKRGGWFITKVFRSRDYEPLKWVLSQFFRTVRAIKPEASRLESAEIFLVGQFYRAPDRIDSRFLDPKYVFGEVDVPKDRTAIVSAFLKDNKKKRKAEGYAEGDTLYHELPLSKFLESEDPLETLAKTHKIIMDSPEVENHILTTAAIKEDLQDIQVLGKAEIKALLKWRTKVLASLKESNKQSEAAPASIGETTSTNLQDEEDNEDLAIETEVQRLLDEEEKQKKKRLKRIRKEKRKIAERLVLKMDHEGDQIEQTDDLDLFSLSKINDLVALEQANQLIGDTSQTGADDLAREEQAASLKLAQERYAEQRRSAIEGRKRVHFDRRGDGLDNFLDDDDDDDNEDAALMRKYQRDDIYISSSESDDDDDLDDDNPTNNDDNDDDDEDSQDGGDEDDDDSDEEDVNGKLSTNLDESSDSDEASANESQESDSDNCKPKKSKVQSKSTKSLEKTSKTKRTLPPGLILKDSELNKRNPLLVDLDDADESVKKKRKIDSWFESDEMKELLAPIEDDPESADESSDLVVSKTDKKAKAKQKKSKKEKNKTQILEKSEKSAGPLGSAAGDKPIEESVHKLRRLRRPLTPEERALALKLIRSAKSRRELIESGYHRFQFFEKASQLPNWFVEDEQKHMRKPLPISKAEVETPVATMGRSISKVEEARARKKARLAKKMKRIRQKVEGISDEIPENEKWQQIQQMYKKAGLMNKKRRPLHLIVNTKGGARNQNTKAPKGAKVKIVDKRMKADLRGQERANRGKRKGKAKSKGGNRRNHGGTRRSAPVARKTKGKH